MSFFSFLLPVKPKISCNFHKNKDFAFKFFLAYPHNIYFTIENKNQHIFEKKNQLYVAPQLLAIESGRHI